MESVPSQLCWLDVMVLWCLIVGLKCAELDVMSRLTISLDDAMHQALKEAAARQGRSIGKIIEEGLILHGIKPLSTARDLVARARLRSTIDGEDAMNLVDDEVRAKRKNSCRRAS